MLPVIQPEEEMPINRSHGARGSRRVLHRRGLTTLALSGRAVSPPLRFFRDPEITATDIWLGRLSDRQDNLKVVHLSDIHHGLYTSAGQIQRVVQLANRQSPDLVALTGDYVTASPNYIWPVAEELGKLRPRLGVFAVLGNHDFAVDAEEITRALETHGIRVLRNSNSLVHDRGASLWVVGVDDLWSNADDLRAAVAGVPARDPKLLLCHNPLGIHQAAAYGIDLVLAGHTHGGQVKLPLLGSLYARSKLGERFIEGWNRLDSTQIYVSRGIGKVVIPVRVGCRPEIACLRLRRPRLG